MTLPGLLLEGYANFRTGRYASEAERYQREQEAEGSFFLDIEVEVEHVDPAD